MISPTDPGGQTHSLRHKSHSSMMLALVAKSMLSKWVGDEFRPLVGENISPDDISTEL
jgi:hypothetical protein